MRRPLLALAAALLSIAVAGCPREEEAHRGAGHHPPLEHREGAAPCPVDAPMGRPDPMRPGCIRDGECTAGRAGRCNPRRSRGDRPDGGAGKNECSYDACYVDGDCGERRVCVCGRGDFGERHYCADRGDCLTDGDCGPGGYCSPSRGYHCHTKADECTDERDCTGGARCDFDPARGRWRCGA